MEKLKIKSPLEVNIILHYHITSDPFPNIDTPAVKEAIDKFCDLGILIRGKKGDIKPNWDATNCFVNKLMEIELPVKEWV